MATPPGLSTLKITALLETPPAAVTTTLPVVIPLGTWATMLVALQLLTVTGTELSVTRPVPCVAPKFVPVMVNGDPKPPPAAGEMLVIAGAAVTVNVLPLLATPPAAVTTTLPVTAPVGTVATMLVGLQLVIAAASVPNFTPPLPCVEPKFDPLIVTTEPTAPVFGARLAMLGAGVTVNVDPLLGWPPTVTTTEPVAAPVGTGAVIDVALQAVGVDAIPLKLTVLLPCGVRKLVPAITTELATAPVLGVRLVIVGAGEPKGRTTFESKLPFSVPSMSSSPLNAVAEVAVRFTPTQR
jgi:hypothetical protein